MKKFAKLMSVVLAIAMLFAMAIPVASVAAEDKITVSVETVDANAGDKAVEVKVFMNADPHWSAVGFTFNFDASNLTYKGWSWNDALKEQTDAGENNVSMINKNNAASGEVIITFATTVELGGYEGYYPVEEDGTAYDYLGTLKFDVAEGAEDGLYDINVTVDKLSTPGENNTSIDVPFESSNGGIRLGGGDEPPAPTNPVVSGVTEGQEFDLSKEEKPAPTWEPAEATATLNGEPYTAGTEIAEAGDYTLVVSDDAGNSTTVNFKVVDGGEQPPEPFDGVEVVVETVAAAAGDTGVEVKVFMDYEPHWSAVGFTFNFDASKLTYKGWSWNDALKEQTDAGENNVSMINKNNAASGEVIITFATTVELGGYEGYYPVQEDGTAYDYLGTLKFDVAEGAEDGLHAINVTVDKLSTPGENNTSIDVPFKSTNGGIKLGEDECDHDWVETDRVAATCTEPGKITYTCSKCGEIKEETIDIDPDAHDWVEIGRTPATCVAEGVINYACSINPEHLKDEPIAIDPDAHAYGEPTYEWAEDNSTCTATMVCANDASHVVTETVNTTSETTEGKTVYTATFENKAFETQTKEVEQPPVEPTTPVVSGVTEGQEFDLSKDEKPAPTWEPAEATATLNGESYTAGTAIDKAGDYTLVVTNGDKTTTVNFKVVDNSSTEPGEPTAPAVTGITDGQEFDLAKGEKPAPTWEPADATATLNGKPYTAGTAIDKAGDYTLVVTNGDKTTTIKFTVKDSTATNPDQPKTSDLPVAGIAIIALIASAAVVVIARKKRFAR